VHDIVDTALDINVNFTNQCGPSNVKFIVCDELLVWNVIVSDNITKPNGQTLNIYYFSRDIRFETEFFFSE
jgi:hypothetical protein